MSTIARGRAARVGVSAMALAGVGVAVSEVGPARAALVHHGAVVVQVVNRSPIGNMLATTSGASLYVHPGGPCTRGCLTVWPALFMPSGKTTPKGAACLTTVARSGGLQVAYRTKALYTFSGDSGSSVNGNGVGGFLAAKVSTKCP